MSPFQLVVTAIFGACIVLGVGVFALYGGAFGGGGVGTVEVWGTAPQGVMDNVLDILRQEDQDFEAVKYVAKDARAYEQELLNAMAAGSAPDLFLVTQEQIGAFEDKVVTIPYGAVSQSQFINSYVDEGQLFLTAQGSLALPFAIDPLVMYWNRDIFAGAGVAQAPKTWSEFTASNGLPTKINVYDHSQLTRSAVALGTWQNVDNAKAILSTLFLQAGDPVTARDYQGALAVVLGSAAQGQGAAESALRFYTEFANPSKTTYSWNRSLPGSQDAFVSGKLGIYFGFASEYTRLIERNPNLRFAVAMVPQLQGSSNKITFGRLTGLAIPRGAKNISGAGVVAQKLTSVAGASALMSQTGLPAARRDTVPDTSANAVAATFVQSALVARGWIDPNSVQSDNVFKTMVESVVSGRQEPAAAIADAAEELRRLLP